MISILNSQREVSKGGSKRLRAIFSALPEVIGTDLKVKLLLILSNIGFKSRAVGDSPVQIWGGSMGADNSMWLSG
jgi:hypothetical protein